MSGWSGPGQTGEGYTATWVYAAAAGLLLLLIVLLAGCGGTPPQSAGTKVQFQTVDREVRRPCPVSVPPRPGPLARPLPADPGALASLLVAKLKEWAGAGGYGDKADDALKICTRP